MFKEFFKSSLSLKIIFVICIAIIFFIGAISYKHIDTLSDKTKKLEHTYKTTVEIEKLISYVKDAETGQRGYILSDKVEFLEPYYTAKKNIDLTYNKIDKLTLGSNDQQMKLKKLRLLINKRLNYLSYNLNLYKQTKKIDRSYVNRFTEGKIIMDSIRSEINDMEDIEKTALSISQNEYKNTAAFTPIYIYLSLLFTLLLITISFIKINKDLANLKKTNNDLMLADTATKFGEVVGKYGSWQWNIEKDEWFFSDNLFRILGAEPKSFEMNLENFFKFMHPEDLDYVKEKAAKMITDEDLPAFNYRVLRPTGEIIHVKSFGRPVYDKIGSKLVAGCTVDITHEYQHQKTIEERNRILEESNKELQSFNYVASHDLQEPLRKIQTFISRLDEKDGKNLSDNGKEYLSRIISSAERMRILINDLLQYSRTSRSDKSFEKTNLNELYENALVDLTQFIEDKNAFINCDNLPILNVIPYQIQQLFINLISNSLKYSKAEINPELTITCKKIIAQDENLLNLKTKDKFYKIEFKDNGIGFEQQYADKIFILFNRLHGKTEYSGTGIGLAICKKIIENHKGFIFANGQPNIGATFTIYLPEN
ncbi:CHASE3 domain-containing protein [Flavobacterium sp.]|uniref:sensor histidine kinase n=1 Tax=Flavobacterium sp. TaxID=239 RepID=UPI0035B1D330